MNWMRSAEAAQSVFWQSLFDAYQAPRHEGVCRRAGIAPRILNFGTVWSWVVKFHVLTAFPPQYPLVGLHSRCEHTGEEKNMCQGRESNRGRPARSLSEFYRRLRVTG
jgi:hypothetical protein